MSEESVDRLTKVGDFAGSAFRLYQKGLHRFLMRRLHRADVAEDVAQEVYLRLLRVEDIHLVRRPQAYVYRIATNVVYELRLRQQHDPVTFDSEMARQATENVASFANDDDSTRLSTTRQLESVLSQLTPMYRAILVLRKSEGMSSKEIAQELGISVHTVKKYLQRAVAQCRAAKWDR